ncbi:hypothetical protein HO133_004184 [Letharia lupina]|uniref:Heterokaryon incompatibility domain-containing protein n=1 Tax=Letharia lupina TaxID=560253 RepID=A0A8H6KZG5_9LECA|nr:uncharacterized protein HO133_004184 [Letharia lupina]KAF6229847.1 hypothetical protein HO133_004184 [Letharia lupina]
MSSNLKERTREILFASLPLTFRDAVKITRHLKVRYLWIDSLCIIQDSPEDWEEEIAIMGQVYARSLITLTASMSRNSDGGCRVGKRPAAENNQPLDILKGSKRIRIFENTPLDWNNAWNRGPLRKRAWTLQERQLSTRSLHFSETLLLWECKTSKASSELPWMQMRIEDPPSLLMLNDAAENIENSGSLSMRDHWFSIVEDYSQRSLTYEADKLPALSGLAQALTQSHGTYFAGLFRMDLPSALLWRSKIAQSPHELQPRRPCHYRAPSWSWAAVEGAIVYDSQRLDEAVSEEGSMSFYEGSRALSNRESERVGVIYPDVLSELQGGQIIFCMEVRKERYWSKVLMPSTIYDRNSEPKDEEDSRATVMGLALVKDDEHTGGYKRVGLVRWMKRSCFSDVEACEITIY